MKIVIFFLMALQSILTKDNFAKLCCVIVNIINQVVGKENVVTVVMEKSFLLLI